jgi:adenylate cyclase
MKRQRIVLFLLTGGALVLLAAGMGSLSFFQTVERQAYDLRCRWRSEESGPTDVALVLVDEETLSWFRETFRMRWPFHRDVYGPVLRFLKAGGARAVAFDIQFSEPEEFDSVLAADLKAFGDAWLPYTSEGSVPEGVGEASSPCWSLEVEGEPPAGLPSCTPLFPVPNLAAAARSGGLIDMDSDSDGVLRWVALLHPDAQGGYHPTLGLSVSLGAAGKAPLRWETRSLRWEGREIPLSADGRLLVRWPSPRFFPSYSFSKIYANGLLMEEGESQAIDPGIFKDKVVFIGTSASGTFDLRPTPVDKGSPGVLLHASVYHALRAGRYLQRAPSWINHLLLGILAYAVAAAALFLPSAGRQCLAGAGIGLLYAGLNIWFFNRNGWWIDLTTPLLGVVFTFTAGSLLNYITEGRQRRQIRHAFQHYLAPEVVDELCRDPSKVALGGERRPITAFFSDIAGFTTLSERMDPAELVAFLNEYLTAMTDLILEEGGAIDKYEGDAIIAMFGAPLAQADHADRALRAAIRCQERLAELRAQWQRQGKPVLSMRIGLNSGIAVVGNMGSTRRFDYTMMGDTVNLASRLEGANKIYGTDVLIGEETARLLEGKGFLLREVDRVRVKGKANPIRIFSPEASSRSEQVRLFHEGLRNYRERRWREARESFERGLSLDPQDGPAKIYLERCMEYERVPPPPTWDGVFQMTEK